MQDLHIVLHRTFTAVPLTHWTSMDRNLILLSLVISSAVGKYVYIKDEMFWLNAQTYCRNNHTDLAPVHNYYDINYLRRLVRDDTKLIWIGMQKNGTNPDTWLWSGGLEVTRFFWQEGEPSVGASLERYGAIRNLTWYDMAHTYQLSFLCYEVHAIREKKSWEDALKYCKNYRHNLASLASKTEMMLMKKELRENYTTEYVWIGLHFLAGDWLWVDWQHRGYEAWGPKGKNWCPSEGMTCAALQMIGPKQQNLTADGMEVLVTVEDVQMWTPRNCNEKLHFLCY